MAHRVCEVAGRPAAGWWDEPASAATSLAFVVVGLLLVLLRHRLAGTDRRRRVLQGQLAALTVLVGAGSFVQHGPGPSWNGVVHDPPLAALLCFVAGIGAADLLGVPERVRWWLVPGIVCAVLAALAPPVSAAWQGAAAVVAVAVTVLRAARRPALRRWLVPAVVVLGAGALVGTLGRPGGPLCTAFVPVEPHAVWHVLAAVAVGLLAPTVGPRGPDAQS